MAKDKIILEMFFTGIDRNEGKVFRVKFELNKLKYVNEVVYDNGNDESYHHFLQMFDFKLDLDFSGPQVDYRLMAPNGDPMCSGCSIADKIIIEKILYNDELELK